MSSFTKKSRISVIIDGQFGSTGKGLISGYLADREPADIYCATVSPNMGHTCISGGGSKITLSQLPIGGVINPDSRIVLTADSVIQPEKFRHEIEEYGIELERVYVHPRCTILTSEHRVDENKGVFEEICSTRSGTGSARASKVRREATIAENYYAIREFTKDYPRLMDEMDNGASVVMETSQGFGLGLNSGLAYPYCTSREITVASALGEAGCHPSYLGSVMLTMRTLPIRVGNTKDGWSGPFYDDSIEKTWERFGLPPEYGTITGRQRRIATFSIKQYFDALHANKPSHVFLNFLNYMKNEDRKQLIEEMSEIKRPTHYGYGKTVDDVWVF